MGETGSLSPTARFTDPSVATVIFAPKPQNYTLASVSFDEPFLEGLGSECWVDPGEPRQQVLRGFGWEQLEWLTSEYLRNVMQALTTTLVSTRTGISTSVPARTYPFASHFSLLGGATEGVFIDPDEFSEQQG